MLMEVKKILQHIVIIKNFDRTAKLLNELVKSHPLRRLRKKDKIKARESLPLLWEQHPAFVAEATSAE
jgi:hypothetical protein